MTATEMMKNEIARRIAACTDMETMMGTNFTQQVRSDTAFMEKVIAIADYDELAAFCN